MSIKIAMPIWYLLLLILTRKERLWRAWHRRLGAEGCLGSSKSSRQGQQLGTEQWSKAPDSQPASSVVAECGHGTPQFPQHSVNITWSTIILHPSSVRGSFKTNFISYKNHITCHDEVVYGTWEPTWYPVSITLLIKIQHASRTWKLVPIILYTKETWNYKIKLWEWLSLWEYDKRESEHKLNAVCFCSQ